MFSVDPPIQGAWLLNERVQLAIQTYRLVLYFFDEAGLHGAVGSHFRVETVPFGGPRLCTPQHVFVKGSDGIEFVAPVAQLCHVDGYSGQFVIVRGGRHIGFVGTALYLRWHDKTQSRKALVTAPDGSSVTVKVSLCACVVS